MCIIAASCKLQYLFQVVVYRSASRFYVIHRISALDTTCNSIVFGLDALLNSNTDVFPQPLDPTKTTSFVMGNRPSIVKSENLFISFIRIYFILIFIPL